MPEESSLSDHVRISNFVYALLVEVWKQIGLPEREWLSPEDTADAIKKGGWLVNRKYNFTFHPYALFYAFLVLQSRTEPPPCEKCSEHVNRVTYGKAISPIVLTDPFTKIDDLARNLLLIAFGPDKTWDWGERRGYSVWDYSEFIDAVLYPYVSFVGSFSSNGIFGRLRPSWDQPQKYSAGQITYRYFSFDPNPNSKPKGPSL